ACDYFQQLARDFVGIGIKKTDPTQIFNLRQLFEQKPEPVFQSEIFSVAGGILPDQSDLPHPGLSQALGFGHHRLKSTRPKLSSQLRDDTKCAGMIAAFGNLYVGRMLRSS